MNKPKYYLITCTGQGDTYINIVDQESWDWMNNPLRPLPEAVAKRLFEDDPDLEDEIKSGFHPISKQSSSKVNDAALMLRATQIDGKTAGTFESVKEVLAFIRQHNIEIEDSFEGYVY